MPRVSIVCAGCVFLYGASCFVLPISLNSLPRAKSGLVVELPIENKSQTPERNSWSSFALGTALGLLIATATARPTFAADLEKGDALLSSSCTACHVQGSNFFALAKINQDAVVEYRKHDVQATIARMTDGGLALPSVGQKLRLDNFEDVANYVYTKADKW
ncbi:Cytochrome c6 [Symbiodinium microadriaticum]|uniref:Cytochrome c6 n=1 Tax=Symbiodinium microadriaticum TaxID=2951 RepID=A0A1Q9DXJ8_SYMMI|nr:Cytochrome c6 [Symbiodinium microadriaticum]CAE7892753.1 petJ [Symbiodinium microadriaticum]